MKIAENQSLKNYNTFGIDVKARYFAHLTDTAQLPKLLSSDYRNNGFMILGGGSNVLFRRDFDGLVIHNSLSEIEITEHNDEVLLTANSGENWNYLVMFCVNFGLGGIENLSLIPGTVGAAPMQNIGAYGVELKDVFHSLEAIDLESLQTRTFNTDDCSFGYRESVFKNIFKDRFFIKSVTLKLSKKPVLHLAYGAIQETLDKKGIKNPTIKDVSNAVIDIRTSKLPDPAVLGNSGSFFKNPVISISDFDKLKIKFPDLPNYPLNERETKIPAAWLIEHCGWKGKVVGHTGSHKNQALVLVNYGGATGDEVYSLAMDIIASVKNEFGIELKPEVNII
jgi:UDP-N-acetylmuramate dehydrogenase